MVKIYHADEPFKRLNVDWLGEIGDGFDFGRKRSDAVVVYRVTKEVDFGNSKLALFWFDDQTVVLEAIEESAELFLMFIVVLACHQDVVEVHKKEIEVLEDGVHEPLE